MPLRSVRKRPTEYAAHFETEDTRYIAQNKTGRGQPKNQVVAGRYEGGVSQVSGETGLKFHPWEARGLCILLKELIDLQVS